MKNLTKFVDNINKVNVKEEKLANFNINSYKNNRNKIYKTNLNNFNRIYLKKRSK